MGKINNSEKLNEIKVNMVEWPDRTYTKEDGLELKRLVRIVTPNDGDKKSIVNLYHRYINPNKSIDCTSCKGNMVEAWLEINGFYGLNMNKFIN